MVPKTEIDDKSKSFWLHHLGLVGNNLPDLYTVVQNMITIELLNNIKLNFKTINVINFSYYDTIHKKTVWEIYP